MDVLEILGLVLVAIVGYRAARAISTLLYSWLAPSLGMGAQFPQIAKWALITGATDGLGKAFAQEFANMGINVVLVSRSKDKLTSVAAEIEEEFKVTTKIVEADFTKGPEIYDHIEQEISGMDIGILVNNIGMSYPHPDYFLDLKDKTVIYNNMIKCNVNTVVSMCQIVMGNMVRQKKGVIINISSTAAHIPSPLLSVYSATKVFVSKFSKDLGAEYKKSGITVQCLVPGYIATKMSKIRKPTWMAPSPRTYVKSALRTVGIHPHTTGYYPHSILLGWINLMEDVWPSMAERMVIRTMENIKARSEKKAASLNKKEGLS